MNSIYVNAIFSVLFCAVITAFLLRATNEWGAVVGLGLLCFVPMVGTAFSSGGLEALNLFLLTAMIATAGYAIADPNEDRIGLHVMTGILLAHTRYESVIFVLSIACVMTYIWIQERRFWIPKVLYLAPLLLAPYLLQNQIFKVNPGLWQMRDVAERDLPFSYSYIPENLERAVYLFFNENPSSATWLPLTLLGSVSLVFFFVTGITRIKVFSSLNPYLKGFALTAPGFLALFLLLLCYGWEFDSVVTARLSLPIYLFFALSAAIFVGVVVTSRVLRVVIVALIASVTWVYGVQKINGRKFERSNQACAEFEYAERMLEHLDRSRVMLIGKNGPFFHIMGFDFLVTSLANQRKQEILNYIESGFGRDVYHLVAMAYSPSTGQWEPFLRPGLSADFITEVVDTQLITHSYRLELQRVVDVEDLTPDVPKFERSRDFALWYGKNLP